ncbi:MAG: pyridoxamine 5'-phosphate oxidase family protein [Chloroflexota bacterium]|nr:pyridoxamine 5'-phosphate oxidase family protein [Chloroflexia bacterium]MDQ3168107.1 pyridoxamine 5'-phosphate oxidase family protein [Chloroflexota bacterium]
MATTTEQEHIAKLHDLIKDIEFAMMTTVEPDGDLRSRPMATQQAEFDGTLWFFTLASDPKVAEVRRDQRVNLSFASKDDNAWVSMSGTAELVRDQAKMRELWSKPLEAWFPDGVDDPNLSLLKVTVGQAEYWDATSNKIAYVAGMIKAIASNQSYQPGENEKITLREG